MLDAKNHVAIHLNEPPIAVIGETRVTTARGQALPQEGSAPKAGEGTARQRDAPRRAAR